MCTAKKGLDILANPLILLVRPEGFEPSTFGFVVRKTELLPSATKWCELRYIFEISGG